MYLLLIIPENSSFGPYHFGLFLTHKLQNKVILNKIICVNFKFVHCKKIWKCPCTDFSKYRKNLILGPFWASFGPKTSKQSYSQKIIYTNFKSLCCFYFVQKIRKFHALPFDNTWKILFRPHFGLLLAQQLQNKVISKKIICASIRSSCCRNFMQKIRKAPCTDFS